VTVGASIGVTLYPLDNNDPDMLLRHADQAMYHAKQSGRNRVCLFSKN
jgi:diguanylate cyclase (GGDEF)-like protein